MPGTMTENENRLSLLSIEVLISHVQLNLGIECHLPCIVFRLLDYPAVSIPYFDQWQINDFHNLKRIHPHLTWHQLLSDQFYELRSANGKFVFKRGKSCLFKAYFKTLYTHLLNVPLFILLTDQINNHYQSENENVSTTQFIGSGNVKLNDLIGVLHQSIVKHGSDIPLVEQETFHCNLFNLMGNPIGNCDIAIRFCHYGTTILTQLPLLDEKPLAKIETETDRSMMKAKPPMNKTITLRPASAELSTTDTIIRHIPIVNEKKDVGLQLSRCDLPISSLNTKSAQTHWTSTKSRPRESHQARGRYLLAIEDPTIDDPTLAFYRPPPLYFNSDSDFLQMMTPATMKEVDKVKENRLAYLASVPIASFDDQPIETTSTRAPPKRKVASHNRATSSSIRIQPIQQKEILAKDFLSNFPLLRSLVKEALALQQQQQQLSNIHLPIQNVFRRPREKTLPRSVIRTQSARFNQPSRTKSANLTRKPSNPRRLYPPAPSAVNQMTVTKTEVRDLVNHLSKPKSPPASSKIDHDKLSPRSTITLSRSPKPLSTSKKPTITYGKTRAHLLLAEYSRARRAKYEKAVEQPSVTLPSPRVENKTVILPRSITISTPSPVPLLNKVDVDTSTIEKNTPGQPSIETIQENTSRSVRFSPTASQDLTSKVNPIVIKTISIISDHTRDNDQRNDDLNFSITDITDYFTEGDDSTRPPTRQSK